MELTKFRWFFWSMIKDFNKEDFREKYTIKKAPKKYFLLAKYLPIVLACLILYTRYDFTPSVIKFLEISTGVVIGFFLTTAKITHKKLYIAIGFFVIIVVACFLTDNIFSISYILKYTFTFMFVFTFLVDTKKDHYYVYDKDNNFVANATKEV